MTSKIRDKIQKLILLEDFRLSNNLELYGEFNSKEILSSCKIDDIEKIFGIHIQKRNQRIQITSFGYFDVILTIDKIIIDKNKTIPYEILYSELKNDIKNDDVYLTIKYGRNCFDDIVFQNLFFLVENYL